MLYMFNLSLLPLEKNLNKSTQPAFSYYRPNMTGPDQKSHHNGSFRITAELVHPFFNLFFAHAQLNVMITGRLRENSIKTLLDNSAPGGFKCQTARHNRKKNLKIALE